MTSFTPWSSLCGGLLIGSAALLLWLFNGRVAGISGILANCLVQDESRLNWRLLFLAGIFIGVGGAAWVLGTPDFSVTTTPMGLVFAGLLVGFGTQLGSGCTSGHGICGISRGSTRSLLATAIFMATGILTVYLIRHTTLFNNGGLF